VTLIVGRGHFGIAANLRLPLKVIRLWQDLQRVVLVATSAERCLPRRLVLRCDDVVVQLPEQRQQRRSELPQRRAGIMEVQPADELPVRMVLGAGKGVRHGPPESSGKRLTGGCVLVPPLTGSRVFVLQSHHRNDVADGLRAHSGRRHLVFRLIDSGH
jgi:hypothetical protein